MRVGIVHRCLGIMLATLFLTIQSYSSFGQQTPRAGGGSGGVGRFPDAMPGKRPELPCRNDPFNPEVKLGRGQMVGSSRFVVRLCPLLFKNGLPVSCASPSDCSADPQLELNTITAIQIMLLQIFPNNAGAQEVAKSKQLSRELLSARAGNPQLFKSTNGAAAEGYFEQAFDLEILKTLLSRLIASKNLWSFLDETVAGEVALLSGLMSAFPELESDIRAREIALEMRHKSIREGFYLSESRRKEDLEKLILDVVSLEGQRHQEKFSDLYTLYRSLGLSLGSNIQKGTIGHKILFRELSGRVDSDHTPIEFFNFSGHSAQSFYDGALAEKKLLSQDLSGELALVGAGVRKLQPVGCTIKNSVFLKEGAVKVTAHPSASV